MPNYAVAISGHEMARANIVVWHLTVVCPSMAPASYHLCGVHKFQGAAIYVVQFSTLAFDLPTDYTAAIAIR